MTAHEDTAIETALKMNEVVELRRRRLTFEEIGQRLGCSRQWAHELYGRALAEIPAANVDAHRAEMLDQLDEAERAVLAVLHGRHVAHSNGRVVVDPATGDPLVDDGPILDAARTLVAIQARKARLLGADAATKVETDLSVLKYEVVGVEVSNLV